MNELFSICAQTRGLLLHGFNGKELGRAWATADLTGICLGTKIELFFEFSAKPILLKSDCITWFDPGAILVDLY
jgi:hypothetical protein